MGTVLVIFSFFLMDNDLVCPPMAGGISAFLGVTNDSSKSSVFYLLLLLLLLLLKEVGNARLRESD